MITLVSSKFLLCLYFCNRVCLLWSLPWWFFIWNLTFYPNLSQHTVPSFWSKLYRKVVYSYEKNAFCFITFKKKFFSVSKLNGHFLRKTMYAIAWDITWAMPCSAVGRSENPGGGERSNMVRIIYLLVEIRLINLPNLGFVNANIS